MEALERDRLKALQQEQVAEDPETDTVLENLDNELRSLIQVGHVTMYHAVM